MPQSVQKPVVTFALVAYNQEQFIREAVEAAFAQTYSPLEIVLSDDCSEDGTFEIIQQLAVSYRGPHRLILNRNPVRQSIGGQFNRVVEMSHGELIVEAAGDDVSLPQRTASVYAAWEQSGRRATSIHSDIIQIDGNGSFIEQIFTTAGRAAAAAVMEQSVEPLAYVETLEPIVFGCAHAFSRSLFKVFGDLPKAVIHEDNALVFRSILAGRIVYIDERLVKYRVHSNNVFIRSRMHSADLRSLEWQEDRLRRDLRNRETMYDCFLQDLDKARLKGLIGAMEAAKVEQEARRRRDRFSLMIEFLESGFSRKCRVLFQLSRDGLEPPQLRMLARRLLPRPLLLPTRLACSCAARALGRRA